jgi:hypothetical protein
MTRYTKNSSGKYVIKGKTYDTLFGSRASVYHGNAYKTVGELVKSDIMMNKNGRIVSVRKHNTAKREKRLVRAGYLTKKGHFGFIKNGKNGKMSRGRKSRSRKHRRGGGHTLTPSTLKSGGRRRRRRGGSGGSSLSYASYPSATGNIMDSSSLLGTSQQDMMSNGSPLTQALSHGGRRRQRRRKSHRG